MRGTDCRYDGLVLCASLEEYEEVAASLLGGRAAWLPLLGLHRRELAGLPASLERMTFEAWASLRAGRGHEVAAIHDSDRLCLCVELEACVPMARVFARRTGRELVFFEDMGAWHEVVLARFGAEQLRSVVTLFPSWSSENGRPDARWLQRVVAGHRALPSAARALPAGLLTALEPRALSRLVAKALLQKEVQGDYATAPATVFCVSGPDETTGSPLRRSAEGDPIQLFDEQDIASGAAEKLCESRQSVVVFKGHGRNYCACQGFLCGARSHAQDPKSVAATCVLGMQCASASFPRIDPRRYDAPIMVIDACGAANSVAPSWDGGAPSVALLALSGAPSAVIASDGITLSDPGDHVDHLWALRSQSTIGQATAALNRLRTERGQELQLWYFVFGDPDIATGASRWPTWTRDANISREEGGRCMLAIGGGAESGFAALTMAHDPQSVDWSTYVSRDEEVGGTPWVRTFRHAHGTDVWLASSDGTAQTLTLERAPTPQLPVGLVEHATSVPLTCRAWSPELAGGAGTLREMADRILRLGYVAANGCGAILHSAPGDARAATTMTVNGWVAAHARCVQEAAERFEGGLWPFRMWGAGEFKTVDDARPCEYCAISPSLRREYVSYPGLRRTILECRRCDLCEDRPAGNVVPKVALDLGPTVAPGSPNEVVLTLNAADTEWDSFGAGCVLVEGKGHGVRAEPARFQFSVAARGCLAVRSTLSLAQQPLVPHRYRVRALLLINGLWYFRSRNVMVAAS